MQFLPMAPAGPTPHLSAEEIARLKGEVRALAEERNAVILAHNYQVPEVQDVADFVGDSLGLSRRPRHRRPTSIVFCGVHFMAETASVLSPDKTVLLPDLGAGCSLADSITADELRALEGKASGRDRGDVREHHRRGQGRGRLLLHVLQRGRRRRARLPRARRRHRDPVRPRHVPRRLCRAASPAGAARLDRRVPRARRHPARRHRRVREEHPDAEFLVHPECGC